MKLIYQSNIDELHKLTDDIKSFAEKHHLDENVIFALNLCLDEALTNIITHGLNHTTKDQIEIDLVLKKNHVTAIILDNGIPFNPLEKMSKIPDIKAKIEKRNIGGLGFFLIDKYMDNIEYQRKGNQNILTMTKSIHQPASQS